MGCQIAPSNRPFRSSATVIPGGRLSTVIPAAPLPSFPRKRESRTVQPYDAALLASHRWIPAYAGMTVVEPGMGCQRGRFYAILHPTHSNRQPLRRRFYDHARIPAGRRPHFPFLYH